MTHYAKTPYGFEYGATLVERAVSDPRGYVVLTVRTPRESLEITVTPSGLIRAQKGNYKWQARAKAKEATSDKA